MNGPMQFRGEVFSRNLRKANAESEQTRQQNFDMKVLIHAMHKNVSTMKKEHMEALKNARRNSRTIQMEQFYEFEGTNGEDNTIENQPFGYNFNHVSPNAVVPSISSSTTSPSTIPMRPINQNNNKTNQPPSYWPLSPNLNNKSTTTTNDYNNSTSDNLTAVLEEDVKTLTEARDILETQLVSSCAKISHLESTNLKLTKELSELHTKLSEFNSMKQSLVQLEMNKSIDEESRRLRDREKVLRVAAERRATIAEQRAKQITTERDIVMASLKEEKKRVNVLKEARRKSMEINDGLHNGISNVKTNKSLEELLLEMDSQRHMLDNTQYSSRWRENAIKNMDLCLQILYACEREVANKKKVFIDRNCANSIQNSKKNSDLPENSRTTTA